MTLSMKQVYCNKNGRNHLHPKFQTDQFNSTSQTNSSTMSPNFGKIVKNKIENSWKQILRHSSFSWCYLWTILCLCWKWTQPVLLLSLAIICIGLLFNKLHYRKFMRNQIKGKHLTNDKVLEWPIFHFHHWLTMSMFHHLGPAPCSADTHLNISAMTHFSISEVWSNWFKQHSPNIWNYKVSICKLAITNSMTFFLKYMKTYEYSIPSYPSKNISDCLSRKYAI